MPAKINLILQDNLESAIELSIQDRTFNNIAHDINEFLSNHYDMEDWKYETVKCQKFTLDDCDLNADGECSHLTLEQWVELADELDTMGHDTTFSNVRTHLMNLIEQSLATNAEYQVF